MSRVALCRRGQLRWRVAGALCLSGLGAACQKAPAPPHELHVQVTADRGVPMAGAQLRVHGTLLGTTDALGLATLRVADGSAEPPTLALACPPGFEAATPETALVLPAAGSPPPMMQLSCRAEPHDAVVLVHAGALGTSLPVRVDGVPVGQTDALGFAHVHVRAGANAGFEVSLDTSSNEKLVPQNPAREFRLGEADEMFVFDTAVDEPKSASRRRRKVQPRRALD